MSESTHLDFAALLVQGAAVEVALGGVAVDGTAAARLVQVVGALGRVHVHRALERAAALPHQPLVLALNIVVVYHSNLRAVARWVHVVDQRLLLPRLSVHGCVHTCNHHLWSAPTHTPSTLFNLRFILFCDFDVDFTDFG